MGKIFVLEDDLEAMDLVRWLRGKGTNIDHARCLEDAVYYLDYENDVSDYDRLLFDLHIPAADVRYSDGVVRTHRHKKGLNGLDFLMQNQARFEPFIDRLALITGYKLDADLERNSFIEQIRVFNKTDDRFLRSINSFIFKTDGRRNGQST